MPTFKVMRIYRDSDKRDVIAAGIQTEAEAQAMCRGTETSSTTCTQAEGVKRTARYGPWFICYDAERAGSATRRRNATKRKALRYAKSWNF